MTVHVVPSRQSADETILRIAERKPQCYVLSNDRFAEYPDSRIVREDRLTRHTILDGCMIIEDLDIEVHFD
ncbi:MAG: hypothetical protein RMI91_07990 [Gemmatales bacterium]|nr:hypothetical protein [Gemmatales bacterium]MDW7994581.1 hypothetical protein [Gemmatales bacterium]